MSPAGMELAAVAENYTVGPATTPTFLYPHFQPIQLRCLYSSSHGPSKTGDYPEKYQGGTSRLPPMLLLSHIFPAFHSLPNHHRRLERHNHCGSRRGHPSLPVRKLGVLLLCSSPNSFTTQLLFREKWKDSGRIPTTSLAEPLLMDANQNLFLVTIQLNLIFEPPLAKFIYIPFSPSRLPTANKIDCFCPRSKK